MSRFITGGRASGKTTKAMQELEDQGGGVFITQHPIEAYAILRQHGFQNVRIVEVNSNSSVVVDDSERIDVIEVRNGPPIRS